MTTITPSMITRKPTSRILCPRKGPTPGEAVEYVSQEVLNPEPYVDDLEEDADEIAREILLEQQISLEDDDNGEVRQ